MATCLDVSSFFLSRAAIGGRGITPLKLQKLIYYAQGFHLATFNEPLFDDLIEAWDHGPVAPVAYHAYKPYGGSIIPAPAAFCESIFNSVQINFLENIYQEFGRFAAWTLRQMTHLEGPWLAHSNDGISADGGQITQAEMKAFFSKFVTGSNYMDEYISQATHALKDDAIALPQEINSAEDFIAWAKQ